MSLYDRYILPSLLDWACGLAAISQQRDRVVPLARGDVLEVGIGTGRNIAHYDAEVIHKVWGLDPATDMQPRLRRRLRHARFSVELLPLSAETIPTADARFDTVLVTYSLCSIVDPVAALREMKRVLKPGGRLLFCEHGLAPEAAVARWQTRLTPAWRRIAGHCSLDRDIPSLLTRAGFELIELQQGYIRGPRVVSYNYWGSAAHPATAEAPIK